MISSETAAEAKVIGLKSTRTPLRWRDKAMIAGAILAPAVLLNQYSDSTIGAAQSDIEADSEANFPGSRKVASMHELDTDRKAVAVETVTGELCVGLFILDEENLIGDSTGASRVGEWDCNEMSFSELFDALSERLG